MRRHADDPIDDDLRRRTPAAPGDRITVARTAIGVIGAMIGDEVWVPEVARVLALEGAELIVHPTSWSAPEAMHVAATERTEEVRVHLVSVARPDCPAARTGSRPSGVQRQDDGPPPGPAGQANPPPVLDVHRALIEPSCGFVPASQHRGGKAFRTGNDVTRR
ncbi:nitrilase-related carbon-nitrogen hydrolase [Actinomadura luteofluorescens]|uniref:nitrilase-related carbon-nitrogen hydrolase n=1 Tax=Actinomadura luteofluorescens TaxID=46163 RepID=UPI001C53D3DC